MILRKIKNGSKFRIFAIVLDDGTCPTEEFLESLKNTDSSSFKSLINLFNRHADYGPILDIEKSRPIETEENLFEFKTRRGARLMYFYCPGGNTIITHGFKKGDPPRPQYNRAINLRERICSQGC